MALGSDVYLGFLSLGSFNPYAAGHKSIVIPMFKIGRWLDGINRIDLIKILIFIFTPFLFPVYLIGHCDKLQMAILACTDACHRPRLY